GRERNPAGRARADRAAGRSGRAGAPSAGHRSGHPFRGRGGGPGRSRPSGARGGMKVLSANRLTDGRVIYWGAEGQAVENLAEALWLDGEAAEAALASASARPALFANP